MTSILMLDSDPGLVSAVTRALSQERCSVVGVRSVREALDKLARGGFDAAVLDADLIDADQLAAFSALPVILTTSFSQREGAERFPRQTCLLRKPFINAQLLASLHEVCGTPPATESLLDVLRRAHSDAQSVALQVGEARLFIERGELVHAELSGAVGEAALAHLLAQPQHAPVVIPLHTVSRTIQRPFRTLMLDLLCHLEEQEQRSRVASEGDR